jgi:hypothetical protein
LEKHPGIGSASDKRPRCSSRLRQQKLNPLDRAAPTRIRKSDGCAEHSRVANVDAAPEAHTSHRQLLTKG